jgi:hypothetical protein
MSMMMKSPDTYGPPPSSVWDLVLHLIIPTTLIDHGLA